MFGKNIRKLRQAKGLSLQQVASHLGVTRASVSKWEKGHTNPELSRLAQLACLLDVTSSQLLTPSHTLPMRAYPVLEYERHRGVEHFMRDLRSPSVPTYPSASHASEKSFYLKFNDKQEKNLWLTGIASGAMVLFDPSLSPTTDDLIYAHDATGNCYLLYLKTHQGINFYQSFIGNKPLFKGEDYLVLLGVAVESLTITPLKQTLKNH